MKKKYDKLFVWFLILVVVALFWYVFIKGVGEAIKII